MIHWLRRRVRDYLAERLRVPSIESSLRRLARHGFSPAGVFDVGAYRGDFAEFVLDLWPNTFVTCFEPQDSRAADLEALSRKYPNRMRHVCSLLGAEERPAMEFHLCETGSSVLSNSVGQQSPSITIPMTTLDACRRESRDHVCTMLKLDVQGYELDVLRGAADTMISETEVVLAELNFLDIYKDVPLLDELVAWLSQRGFVAYDIGGLIRRPLDDALWQADFLFVRKDGALRADKRWK